MTNRHAGKFIMIISRYWNEPIDRNLQPVANFQSVQNEFIESIQQCQHYFRASENYLKMLIR